MQNISVMCRVNNGDISQTWTLTLHLDSVPALPPTVTVDFQTSLSVCAYRCDNLTNDLDRTRFLTQKAGSFKSTSLPPHHWRNLHFLQKDVLAPVADGSGGCHPEAEILQGSYKNVTKDLRENMKRRWIYSTLNMFILTSLKLLKNHWAELQGINQSEREKEKGQAKESHYFDWPWKITQNP